MTANMRHTCLPISLCSWWGTLRLFWCFPCLHCSRSQGGAAWTGWGSRRPGPGCSGPREANRGCSARPRTGSGRPGWWARQTRAVARASLSSSASKEKAWVISSCRTDPISLCSHDKNTRKTTADFRGQLFDLTWRIFWSRPCQMRGMWLHAHRKSRADDGSSLKHTANVSHSEKLRLITPHKNRLLLIYCLTEKYKKKKPPTCSLCVCRRERWYTAG